MPLSRASVERQHRNATKDGFRLRYTCQITSEAHADDVITRLDDAMGARTKAHGYYQAPYDDLRATYGDLLDEANADRGLDFQPLLRAAAVIVGCLLTVAMCTIVPVVTIIFMVVTAFKKQSGFAAMAEATFVGNIFDWRPLIHRLFNYANTGKW